MNFSELGLSPQILRALDEQGYTQPTPIQAAAIPIVMTGADLLAAAQTGTGKTAGFALPVLHYLAGLGPRKGPAPRVLVLTPTRELAAQILDSVKNYGRHLPLKSAAIFGGVSMGPQHDALRRGLDILIATPGRLIDHLGQRTVDLSQIQVLILDEADRMLDMGFLPALKRVLQALPKQRQTLMFSATFSDPIKALAQQFLHNPQEVSVTPRNTVADTISHIVHPVPSDKKRAMLVDILAQDSRLQTLVFARTKHGANKLAEMLEKSGFKASAIHGNKSQNARTKALAEFKSGKLTVLVATDIAARGLDIPELPVVINFDLPMVAEDYVHRIGRTGRAGERGRAISLVAPDESGLLRDIQRLLKQEIQLVPMAGYELSAPLRMDANAPRPVQGQRGQGRPAGQSRPGGQSRQGGQPRQADGGRREQQGQRSERGAHGGARAEQRQAQPGKSGQQRHAAHAGQHSHPGKMQDGPNAAQRRRRRGGNPGASVHSAQRPR
ncbi:RNA helicase [Ahniella affigens]|uniref:DEAD-box ATP-dependent RNA helicase RhpA n=1 Tax=Ahniella affigens TaxID=2021234 RepID=A0A2P1PU10_9GAMM|nr:DEAD/DEAH box helicase [Ahniella affigens]AVP98320.1 RNA helicase [Ahniella affigens]